MQLPKFTLADAERIGDYRADVSHYTAIADRVIGLFEEFLQEKGIDIPNEDREPDNPTAIYGDDYDCLRDYIAADVRDYIYDIPKESKQ